MKRENIVDIMSLYKTNIFHEDWTANTFELNSDGGDFTLPLKTGRNSAAEANIFLKYFLWKCNIFPLKSYSNVFLYFCALYSKF